MCSAVGRATLIAPSAMEPFAEPPSAPSSDKPPCACSVGSGWAAAHGAGSAIVGGPSFMATVIMVSAILDFCRRLAIATLRRGTLRAHS